MALCQFRARGAAAPIVIGLLVLGFGGSQALGNGKGRPEPIVVERVVRPPSSKACQTDFYFELQVLTDRIKLTRAEIDALERQIAEYERFKTKAFFLTLQNARLHLLDAELRLKQLQREKLLLQFSAKDAARAAQQHAELVRIY